MAGIGFSGEGADGRHRILLVDPYSHSREGLSAALRADGSSVESAEDGFEAAQKLPDGEFDLAIVDLDLPPAHGLAEDGWELVRVLRETSPALLLILIAAECRPDTEAAALRIGAARLLEKPINPRELRSIVRTLRPETAPA